MKKYKVAILGNDATALAIAAFLKERGHVVNFCYDSAEGFSGAITTGEFTAQGVVKGRFTLDLVTKKTFQAVRGTEIIIISVPGSKQANLARKLVPHMEKYQVLLLVPGYAWGAIIASNAIKAENPDLDVYVGETQDSLFSAHMAGDSTVHVSSIYQRSKFCFYPAVDNMHVDYMISGLFPGIVVEDDIRVTSLLCLDAVMYGPVILLNLGSCNKEAGFSPFTEGVSPDVVKVVKKIDEERVDLMGTLGMKQKPITSWFEESMELKNCDYYTMFDALARLQGANFSEPSLESLLIENLEVGIVPLKSLALALEQSTPVIDAILAIASTVHDRDFLDTGRTLELANVPNDLLVRQGPRKVKMEKVPLDSFVDKMCKQILDDFKEGWIFIQASREILNIVKELIHETTGSPINPENWKQYFSSEKKSRVIAVVKKSEHLKAAFQMGDEFEEFYGVILESEGGSLTARPVLFYEKTDNEAKDFIKKLKKEVHEFLDKVIEEEFKAKGKEIILEDMEFEE